jgi:hypothetical protein
VVAIAQQAEHQIVDLGVAGSNPASHPKPVCVTDGVHLHRGPSQLPQSLVGGLAS